VLLSYMTSGENLGMGRVSRGVREAVRKNWGKRAKG